MGEIVLTNCYVRMGPSSDSGAVALSTAVTAATIKYKADQKEFTAFMSGTRRRKPGLKDWSIGLTVNQDFASTDIDKFLFTQIGSTSCWVQVRPTTGNMAASNPAYEGPCQLEEYQPIGQSVGDLGVIPLNFIADGALHRNVAS